METTIRTTFKKKPNQVEKKRGIFIEEPLWRRITAAAKRKRERSISAYMKAAILTRLSGEDSDRAAKQSTTA